MTRRLLTIFRHTKPRPARRTLRQYRGQAALVVPAVGLATRTGYTICQFLKAARSYIESRILGCTQTLVSELLEVAIEQGGERLSRVSGILLDFRPFGFREAQSSPSAGFASQARVDSQQANPLINLP